MLTELYSPPYVAILHFRYVQRLERSRHHIRKKKESEAVRARRNWEG